MTRPSLILAISLALPACYTAKVYLEPRDAPAGTTIRSYQWSLFWGLWTPGAVDAGGQCTAGVRDIRVRTGFLGWLLSGVTGGIVKPLTVRVRCLEIPGGPEE